MRMSSVYVYDTVTPVPTGIMDESVGAPSVTVGALASETFACPGVPRALADSKSPGYFAEYHLDDWSPSPGEAERSMETTFTSFPNGHGASARSYMAFDAFLRTSEFVWAGLKERLAVTKSGTMLSFKRFQASEGEVDVMR